MNINIKNDNQVSFYPLDYFFNSWTMSSIIIKTTNICTFKCKYCFWFRKDKISKLPDLLSEDIEDVLILRIKNHVLKNKLKNFKITFHGGEPLLWGINRYENFMYKVQKIADDTGCFFRFNLQTNGYLINDEWANLFRKYNYSVGVSIDGPADVQNINRRTLEGKDTFDEVLKGINCLKDNCVDFGILAVANLSVDPKKIVDFFVRDLGVNDFDILIPDFTHDDKYESIKEYYINLYDYWLSEYAINGVQISFFKHLIDILLGNSSATECLGYGPMTVITVETNGNVGPTDTLKITDSSNFNTNFNILNSDFSEIKDNKKFRWIIEESLKIPIKCTKCDLRFICGAGYLPHRWSNKTQNFQNPSIYCEDIKGIITHVEKFLIEDLALKKEVNNA